MTKRRPYRSLFERLFSVMEPDIMWHRSVPASIRTPLTFLAHEYNIRIDELFKAMREEAMQQISETDEADAYVGLGRIRSLSGRVLDYEIDIAVAMRLSESDQHHNTLALERDPSIEELITIHHNTVGWLYFWSVRHPSVDHRPRFRELARANAERLHRMIQVKLCGRKWPQGLSDHTTGVMPQGEV